MDACISIITRQLLALIERQGRHDQGIPRSERHHAVATGDPQPVLELAEIGLRLVAELPVRKSVTPRETARAIPVCEQRNVCSEIIAVDRTRRSLDPKGFLPQSDPQSPKKPLRARSQSAACGS